MKYDAYIKIRTQKGLQRMKKYLAERKMNLQVLMRIGALNYKKIALNNGG